MKPVTDWPERNDSVFLFRRHPLDFVFKQTHFYPCFLAAADRVVNRHTFTLCGRQLVAEHFHGLKALPDSDCSNQTPGNDTEEDGEVQPENVCTSPDSFLDESTLDESVVQSYSVEVSGVDKRTSAETIKMYFENEKRSNGGPIDNVWYNAKKRKLCGYLHRLRE